MKYIQVVIVSISLLLIAACGGPQHTKMIDPDFSRASLNKLQSYKSVQKLGEKTVQLHAVGIDDTQDNPVVMIHGTPGDWSTFSFVLGNTKLQETNHLISVDRLDWGQSQSINPFTTSPDFPEQVDAIAAIIRSTTDRPVVLVGHSLGASIAPSVAIKYPELVKGIILVAGTVDPKLGGPRWFNRVARLKVAQWFISDTLINSNVEVYRLKPGLIDADPKWKDLKIPVTVIQGLRDKLVHPENVEYVQKKYAHQPELLNVVTLPKSGHFIPWEHTGEIIRAIQAMNKRFENE